MPQKPHWYWATAVCPRRPRHRRVYSPMGPAMTLANRRRERLARHLRPPRAVRAPSHIYWRRSTSSPRRSTQPFFRLRAPALPVAPRHDRSPARSAKPHRHRRVRAGITSCHLHRCAARFASSRRCFVARHNADRASNSPRLPKNPPHRPTARHTSCPPRATATAAVARRSIRRL